MENLVDVTFLILVRLDTIDRLENILATTHFLLSGFDTNLFVSEYSSFNNSLLERLLDKNIRYVFQEDNDQILHRTKFLNQMTSFVETPFVAVWDSDVLISVNQIIKSVELLRNGEADFVYPYEKYFLDTSHILRRFYLQEKDFGFLERNSAKMKAMYLPCPLGGAFLANLRAYKDAGLENESLYGWGMEDGERYYRWTNHGYKIKRIPGPLFHLSHERGINSVFHNSDQQFYKQKEVVSVRRNKDASDSNSSDAQNIIY